MQVLVIVCSKLLITHTPATFFNLLLHRLLMNAFALCAQSSRGFRKEE
jgi:hypothetical protein